jgi:hypothetical protein
MMVIKCLLLPFSFLLRSKFEAFAADFTKPSREDLANFVCWHDEAYARSPFFRLFSSMGELMEWEELEEEESDAL